MPKNSEHSREIKMKICMIEKSEKPIATNCKSIYYKTIKYWFVLTHDTIQRLNCAVHYLNIKMKEKEVKIIDLQLWSSLK